MKTAFVLTVVGLAATANADITPVTTIADLTQPIAQGTVYGLTGDKNIIAGDTYTAEPLVQDGINAFFTDDAASVFTLGVPAIGGNNLTGAAGSTSNSSSGSIDNMDGTFTAFVTIDHRDATGNLDLWVDAAQAGQGLTSWRADVGSNAGGTDGLAVDLGAGESFNILSSVFVAFNSANASLGAFSLSLDTSNASQLSGLAVIGLGGADIAGFDLSGLQIQWTYEIVPAPASAALLGLGGFAAIRRRR